MDKNTIILFDIDYTLFDVAKYRELVFNRLEQIFPDTPDVSQLALKAYDKIREFGSFEPENFSKQLVSLIDPNLDTKPLIQLWWDTEIIDSSIYPEATEVLKTLSSAPTYTLGIFSSGPIQFQKAKILKIETYFNKLHIHIHLFKDELISEIVEKYKGQSVFVVDDFPPVLEKIKKEDKNIMTVWIKRGRLAEKNPPSKNFQPDFTIENLQELLTIVDKHS